MVKAAALALWLGLAPAWGAEAACRQALVLAVDISGSVDPREHDLQRRGLAAALTDAEVSAAFLGVPEAPVRLLIFEWAGPGTQTVLTEWTEIRSAADLSAIADSLVALPRAEGSTRTATGTAMTYAGRRLGEQAECERLTLDVSTDGLHNIGIPPAEAQGRPELATVTINGLAIGTGWPGAVAAKKQLDQIAAFLAAEVIRGPGAFVMIAADFDDFARAIRRKLLRELQAQVLGRAPGGGAPG